MFSRLQMLFQDPVGFLKYLLIYALVILPSLILHECAHGYVALKCGDPTAKFMGRLSLDPRRHLDPIGTVFMVLFGFGWAKPVPVNPRNYRNPRRDDIFVSLAGITMNLILFLLSTFFYVLIAKHARYQVSTVQEILFDFFYLMATINVTLAIFNLLPIPPLDGYHVFNDIVLRGRLQLNPQTFRIAQIVLMLLCFSGAFTGIISSVNSFLTGAAQRLFLAIVP